MSGTPRLYSDLARWWPLLSPPSHYVEEAADLLPILQDGSAEPGRTLLELGSGGGSLAFHLKQRFVMTLTDKSPEMLTVCRHANPECETIPGDMLSLDLGRQFDRVLIHDAIMYAASPEAVMAALRTAARHCRQGGLVVVLPDCVRETFEPETEHGGEDAPDGSGLRYLEWSWDPDPNDCTFQVAYAFLLRDASGRVSVAQDLHIEGCFARAEWLRWFDEVGLTPRIYMDPWNRDVFIARKRAAA
jgi:SAM-dependent methyltransferase